MISDRNLGGRVIKNDFLRHLWEGKISVLSLEFCEGKLSVPTLESRKAIEVSQRLGAGKVN